LADIGLHGKLFPRHVAFLKPFVETSSEFTGTYFIIGLVRIEALRWTKGSISRAALIPLASRRLVINVTPGVRGRLRIKTFVPGLHVTDRKNEDPSRPRIKSEFLTNWACSREDPR
jgi:hypothetical protein